MKAIKIIDAPNTKVPLNFEGMMDICQAQFLITNPPTTTPPPLHIAFSLHLHTQAYGLKKTYLKQRTSLLCQLLQKYMF